MNIKVIKRIFIIIVFGLAIWILSNTSQAAYVSVKASTTSASPGQTVNITISSDCIGKVNLSASNGTLSKSAVFIDGAQTVSLTVGSSGTAVVSATPVDMSDSNGSPVTIGGSSASVSIKSAASSTSSASTSSTTNSENATTSSDTNKKSSNANLSNLGIRPNDFSGFKAATTTYNVTVAKDVESVEVYATAQDSKAKVSGTGKKQLQEGNNAVAVTVTAEDGTKKTYTINITREGNKADEEETNTEEVQAEGLSELNIGNLQLSPTFTTNVYEYTVTYIGEDNKLDINTTATNPEYVIEITGNEDLKEGENLVTILVSDKEGNNIATYQITVNKSLSNQQETQEETNDSKENQNKMIIGGIVAVVALAIIIFLIIRHKRNKNWEEEYNVPFSGLNNNNDNNQLEDFDENMKDKNENEYDDYESSEENYDSNIDDTKEDKEKLKEQFLNNYNLDDSEDDDWEEERPRKRRHKGKRFK